MLLCGSSTYPFLSSLYISHAIYTRYITLPALTPLPSLAHMAQLQSRGTDASHILVTALRVVSSARLVATHLVLHAVTCHDDTALTTHVLNLLAHLRALGYNLALFEDPLRCKSALAPVSLTCLFRKYSPTLPFTDIALN